MRSLRSVDRALRTARDAAGHKDFKIAIGLVEYTNLPFIPPALIRLQALYPDVTVVRHEMNTAQQIAALAKNEIDIGFGVPVGAAPNGADVLVQPLLEARWALLMRSDHRLANVDCLNLCDLAQERLIVSARAVECPSLRTRSSSVASKQASSRTSFMKRRRHRSASRSWNRDWVQ